MQYFKIKSHTIIFTSAFVLLSCAGVKQPGRDIGHGTRDATQAIDSSTRDLTRDISRSTSRAIEAIGIESRYTSLKSKR